MDPATNTATAGVRYVRTDRVIKQEAAGDENGEAVLIAPTDDTQVESACAWNQALGTKMR